MSALANILFFSPDEKLGEEAAAALESIGESTPRFRMVTTENQLFEVLRNQAIDLVLVEFPSNPKDLIALVPRISTASPGCRIAAILRPEGFPADVSESVMLIETMRCGVCDFLRRPLSTTDLKRLIEQVGQTGAQSATQESTRQGRVVSFISNKGGVGKSTLSTNAGVAVARRNQQSVLLIDGSIQMGVGAALLDLQPTATLADLAKESDRLDATMLRQSTAVHSSGLHLLAAPVDALEAMEVDDVLMARLITLARQTYDLVIVDTFPMFDRVVMAALDLSDQVFLVLENVVPTLLGGMKLIDVMERIGYPANRQSVVLNRQQKVAGSLSIEDVAERIQCPINHVLPFDKRVIAAANCGTPIGMQPQRWNGFSRALERLADDVAGELEPSPTPTETAEDPPALAAQDATGESSI